MASRTAPGPARTKTPAKKAAVTKPAAKKTPAKKVAAKASRSTMQSAVRPGSALRGAGSSPTIDRSVLTEFDIHPFADKFAIMSDAELADLAEDIKRHGQQEPILRYEGQIIDGRNRLIATRHAKVAPVIEDWIPRPGETIVTHIVSRNLRRRHLTQSQRAALALELEEAIQAEHRELREKNKRAQADARKAGVTVAEFRSAAGGTKPKAGSTGTPGVPEVRFSLGRSREIVASTLNVSTGYIQQARKLRDNYPDKFKEILDPEDPKRLSAIQEEIVAESIANSGKNVLDVTAEDIVEDVKLGAGTARFALNRLQERALREAPAEGRPKVKIPKFGKVASSKTSVRIVVTFGNDRIAEELLNSLSSDKRVLDFAFDVLPDDKAVTREKRRLSTD